MHHTLNTAGRPAEVQHYSDFLTMGSRVNTAGYPKFGPNNNFRIRQNRVVTQITNEKVQIANQVDTTKSTMRSNTRGGGGLFSRVMSRGMQSSADKK